MKSGLGKASARRPGIPLEIVPGEVAEILGQYETAFGKALQ
jgi:hypothetical protein